MILSRWMGRLIWVLWELVDHLSMVIDMNESKVRTVAQVRAFLQRAHDVRLLPHGDDEARYGHVGAVLRGWAVYADARFERPAQRSPAHLCNLCASTSYARQRVVRTQTRAVAKTIGTRKAPAPDGRAGFIRIDNVHQGDGDGVKGVRYTIAVDCVTQWDVVVCCERISEAYLMPVLKQLLTDFRSYYAAFTRTMAARAGRN
jgi:hypothetical protein